MPMSFDTSAAPPPTAEARGPKAREGARLGRIRFALCGVSASTTLGLSLAAAPLLPGVVPDLAFGGALTGMLLIGALALGLGAALALVLTQEALAALDSGAADADSALAATRRYPALFTAGSLAIWLAVAGLLSALGAVGEGAERATFLAWAALGLVATAANAPLSAWAVGSLHGVLAARASAAAPTGAPGIGLAWTLRLLVAALVLAPELFARAGGGGDLARSAGLLAVGLGLAELASSAVRSGADALRDAAERAAFGRSAVAVPGGELAGVGGAIARLQRSLGDALGAIESAATELDGELSDLDATREKLRGLTDAQVAEVQQLTQSMSSVYTQSETINESIQELRTSLDESSSAVTELGAAGDQLAGTAAEMLRRAETVSSSIRSALASLGDVASGTDVLAGIAADSSSAMEEIAASMRDVNENAERCASLSDQVVGVADRGSQVVQQTIDGMQAIRQATESAEQVVRGLGERAGEIGAIVDVIDAVANETSLLALNAAIIAAQAGEHGRGFSVVAGEIRELATRVTSSTAEITELIQAVQDESRNAITAIESGSQRVASGVELSELAGQSLVEITVVARDNKKRVQGIVHSVGEQTKAAGHVVGMIDEVRSQAERIRAAAREQERGNDVVLEQAQAMKEMAQQVHHTADEQSRGTRLIAETVESFVSGLDKIGDAVKQQAASCARAVASTWEAYTRAKQAKEAAGGLEDITDALRGSASAVRERVGEVRSR